MARFGPTKSHRRLKMSALDVFRALRYVDFLGDNNKKLKNTCTLCRSAGDPSAVQETLASRLKPTKTRIERERVCV